VGVPGSEAIRSTVRRGVRRLRAARALRRIVALGIPAALLLAAAYLAEHLRGLPPDGLTWAFAAAGALPLAGLLWGLLLPVDRRKVATRIDGASGLHDRLGTAWVATRGLSSEPLPGFSEAAVRDAVRNASRADPVAGIPIRLPKTFRALVLAVIALSAAAWVRFPDPGGSVHQPLLPRVTPPLADPDELAEHRRAATALKDEAEEQRDERLGRIADELSRLVDEMDSGDVERKRAFERIHSLERKLREGAQEVAAAEQAAKEAVKEAAKELKKREETKELAKALEKGDLQAAERALKKLADMLEKSPMSRKLLGKLAKLFEKSALEMAKKFDARLSKELQDEMKRLRELMRKQGLSEREKERLAELQRKLSDLQQKEQPAGAEGNESPERTPGKPQQSAGKSERSRDDPAQQKSRAGMSRMVNRLARRMEQMSKQLGSSKQDPAQAQRQASEEMRKGAQEVKNLHRAMRQQQARRNAQKKLSELKESMRRRGSQQRMGKRSRGFRQRAEGLRKRGRGPRRDALQRGAKAGQPGGRKGRALERKRGGSDKPGDQPDHGAGKGKASKAGGRYEEKFVQGKENAGPMLEEVVLDAAKEGFAQTGYRDAFVRYEDVAEEELARERVPAGYRYHVKRYFDLIRPPEAADGGEEP